MPQRVNSQIDSHLAHQSHFHSERLAEHTTLLEAIKTNTSETTINAGDIELHVDGLEGLVTTTNTTLAAILVDTDAADSSLNTIEAQSVLTASRLNNIQNKIAANVDGTGDTLGQINSNILLKNTDIETSLNSILAKNTQLETLLTAANVDHAANEVLLTNAEAHLGNIDTGVDVLEACVGSNKVNVNIASNAVDFATQTTLAAAEAHLGNIDTATAAIATDQAAIEVLLTAANVDHAANEVLLTNAEAHLGNIDTGIDVLEACVGSNKVNVNIASNAVDFATQTTLAAAEAHLGNIDTATAASATDLAAIEVLITATNSKIDTLDAQVDLLEGTNTIKDVEWLSNASISNQALSDVLDTEGYERVFIYGENSSSVSANNFKIFGSNASAGTYYSVGQLSVVTSDSGRYLLREDSPLHDGPSPRYLKVFNNTGSSQTITTLRAVMSHKLRYV